MRRHHAALLAALAALAAGAVAALAACTLNPQPLPPRDDFAGESAFGDASTAREGGSFGGGPDSPGSADAGTITPAADVDSGQSDAGDGGDGDGGDAADAGDAGDAADADADAG